jgi:hypothetical protein
MQQPANIGGSGYPSDRFSKSITTMHVPEAHAKVHWHFRLQFGCWCASDDVAFGRFCSFVIVSLSV